MLAETLWWIRGQHNQGLPQLFQAWPSAREAQMMAVHDPKVVWDKTRRQPKGTDIFGDHHPALRHRSFEHARVVDPAKRWTIDRQRDGIKPVSYESLGQPVWIVLIQ